MLEYLSELKKTFYQKYLNFERKFKMARKNKHNVQINIKKKIFVFKVLLIFQLVLCFIMMTI